MQIGVCLYGTAVFDCRLCNMVSLRRVFGNMSLGRRVLDHRFRFTCSTQWVITSNRRHLLNAVRQWGHLIARLFTTPTFFRKIVKIEDLALLASFLGECPIYLGGRGRFGRKRYISRRPPLQYIWNQGGRQTAKRSILTIVRKNKGLWTV